MSISGFTPVMPSAAHDAKVSERAAESNLRAAKAEGFGDDNESEAASGDRNADGRQAWQWNQQQRKQQAGQERKSIDPSGKTGSTLDLDG